MNLLLFSDLHTDAEATRGLVQRAAGADVLVGAGDFATVRRNLDVCISILRTVAKPTVLVAGNNETTEELVAACKSWPSAHVLHGSGVVINGVSFFGIDGGIPVTPFGSWSYDFTEEQAEELLADCPRGSVCGHSGASRQRGRTDRSGAGPRGDRDWTLPRVARAPD